ncbi:hypothetical protein B296_00023021 [Ensete ventricosum]|uniref:K Homology domain-containing protein n=1 Tax=Ensete ventricosum TaxID=4639 RepID=A0A426Z2D6_ENSVE|nr:hypothetical protein B296_00023021 [Ensete ventricosum]
MADDLHYSSRPDNKRKFDDPSAGAAPSPPARRATGFSAPIASSSPDGGSGGSAPVQPSYNSVPPPVDGIQLAKQRAQEIAARLFSDAEAKRPRVENGVGADDYKGFGSAASDPNAQTRSVELIGTSEQISKAEQLINDVLAEADAGASGIIAARKFGSVQPGAEQFQMKVPNNKVTWKFNLPCQVGLVIGKGGETIKNMQARSGARIQVCNSAVIPLHLPPGDTSTERTVYIDGTTEQIEAAKQLVNEVTSEVCINHKLYLL